jgi:hypothetical protein
LSTHKDEKTGFKKFLMQPGGRPNAVKRPHSALSASTTATNHTGQKASKQPAGWQLYFPLVEWQPILYQHWLTAFRSILPLMFPDLVEELRLSDNQLRVDYDHLLQSFDSYEYEQQQQQQTDEVDADQTSGSRLQRFLHDQPAVVFSLISLAAYQLATNDRPLPDLTAATIGQVLIIETRLVGHGYYTAMKELKAQMIGTDIFVYC